MPSRDEIAAIAREKMGRISAAGFREWGMLEQILGPDELIEAVALAKLRGGIPIARQRIVVATPQRILLVEKGFVTGRERRRDIPWADVRGVDATPPSRLTLQLSDEEVELVFVQPPAQLAAIADLDRARTGAAPAQDSAELRAIARRKLGRVKTLAVEVHVITLAGALRDDERLLDLAFVAGKPGGLLAVTTARLLFVPTEGRGAGAPDGLSLDEITSAEHDGGDVVVGERRWTVVVPPERAASLVDIVRQRAGSPLP